MIKMLCDLTRKQRQQWISDHGYGINPDYQDDLEYIIRNNSKDDIADWFLHDVTTWQYPSEDWRNVITVWMYNRLYEYVNGLPIRGGSKLRGGMKKIAEEQEAAQ